MASAPARRHGAVEDAERAIELAPDSPRRAHVLATSVLRAARVDGDAEAAAVAERALGLAALGLRDGESAVLHLRRAVRIASRAQLTVRAAEARMSLGRALLYTGDSRGAFRQIDFASASLSGIDGARLELQRAILLHHHHRLDEALDGYRRALTVFRRHGDRLWEARALNNRGLIHAYRGSLAAAEHDLAAAAAIYTELELELALAEVEHNLGWVAARRGDVPTALELYDRSEERRRAQGVPIAYGQSDRCELLLGVRLVDEARQAAERAVTVLARGAMALETAEARLMLAEAALVEGDLPTARREAETAARAFASQRRPRWAALARYAALRAAFAEEGPSDDRRHAARRAAVSLADAGWTAAGLDARLLSARIALALGHTRAARRALAQVRVGDRDPVDLRVRAKYANALLALADGNRRRAYAALRSGVRLLDDYRVALGATELRAQVGGHAEELARLGLRLAVGDGDPRRALTWLEECRAGALGLRPVRPPDNEALASDLAELRRVVAETQEGALAGRDVRGLRRQQVALEESIRRRTRSAPGGIRASTPRPQARLESLLGERALVAYLELDGRLGAVTVSAGRWRLHALGDGAEARGALDVLRFALRRLARRTTSPASRTAAAGSARTAAQQLDELLVVPLAAELGDRPLVLVPTGSLHATPWPIVPSLTGRPVVVAPAAAAWAGAEERAHGQRRANAPVAVAAGPGLPFAEAEARTVAGLHGAEPLLRSAATAEGVLAALDGAGIAHLAAHGSFRADNPLFSSLELADGPLTVYDLESLAEAPSLCVLSACDSGLSEVRAGDELMGLTATLLALGSSTIVASVVAVPDEASTALMSAFHGRLAAGTPPAEALVHAQATVADGDEGVVASAGFVCFGAG
ncbi:MAG TPA: CHAT domain-containing protein [Gaiellaceae bacterium]|nr:CHAT domain-containing protein [Gaiellaceae bacterium]